MCFPCKVPADSSRINDVLKGAFRTERKTEDADIAGAGKAINIWDAVGK